MPGTKRKTVDGLTEGDIYVKRPVLESDMAAGGFLAKPSTSGILVKEGEVVGTKTINEIVKGEGNDSVRLGVGAAETSQGLAGVAVGYTAGYTAQGDAAVAIGPFAGVTNQGEDSICIGHWAKADNSLGSVAVGAFSGDDATGEGSVAVGLYAANQGTGAGAVNIGRESGSDQKQGANVVAVGYQSGASADESIAIGRGARAAGATSVAIGRYANTSGISAVSIGNIAGQTSQGLRCVAVGAEAGNTLQGNNAVAVGFSAGTNEQGADSVAIGYRAGESQLGASSIAIGREAKSQHANTIVLNASGVETSSTVSGSTVIKPVRLATSSSTAADERILQYGKNSSEVTYSKCRLPEVPEGKVYTLASWKTEDAEAGFIGEGIATIGGGGTITAKPLEEVVRGSFLGAPVNNTISVGGITPSSGTIVLNASGTTLTALNPGTYIKPVTSDVSYPTSRVMQYDTSTGKLYAAEDVNAKTALFGTVGAGMSITDAKVGRVGAELTLPTALPTATSVLTAAADGKLGYAAVPSGTSGTGSNSVQLGTGADASGANTIVLNATGSTLASNVPSSTTIKPIRSTVSYPSSYAMAYNPTTGEIMASKDIHAKSLVLGDDYSSSYYPLPVWTSVTNPVGWWAGASTAASSHWQALDQNNATYWQSAFSKYTGAGEPFVNGTTASTTLVDGSNIVYGEHLTITPYNRMVLTSFQLRNRAAAAYRYSIRQFVVLGGNSYSGPWTTLYNQNTDLIWALYGETKTFVPTVGGFFTNFRLVVTKCDSDACSVASWIPTFSENNSTMWITGTKIGMYGAELSLPTSYPTARNMMCLDTSGLITVPTVTPFTPSFSFVGGGSMNYQANSQLGRYINFGKLVFVQIHLATSSKSTSPAPSGNVYITLPFTVPGTYSTVGLSNTLTVGESHGLVIDTTGLGEYGITAYVYPGTSNIEFRVQKQSAGSTVLNATHFGEVVFISLSGWVMF